MNSADEDIDSKFPTNTVVYSNGEVTWVPIGLFISACAIDIQWFPFDEQNCSMKFGSWTYDGTKINLTRKDPTIDLTTYQPSGEWDLLGIVYTSPCDFCTLALLGASLMSVYRCDTIRYDARV